MYVLLGGLLGAGAGYAAAQFYLGGGNALLAVALTVLPGILGHILASVVTARREALAAAAMSEVVGKENFLAKGRALVAARRESVSSEPDCGFDDSEFGLTTPDPVQSDIFGMQTGANSQPAGHRRQW